MVTQDKGTTFTEVVREGFLEEVAFGLRLDDAEPTM